MLYHIMPLLQFHLHLNEENCKILDVEKNNIGVQSGYFFTNSNCWKVKTNTLQDWLTAKINYRNSNWRFSLSWFIFSAGQTTIFLISCLHCQIEYFKSNTPSTNRMHPKAVTAFISKNLVVCRPIINYMFNGSASLSLSFIAQSSVSATKTSIKIRNRKHQQTWVRHSAMECSKTTDWILYLLDLSAITKSLLCKKHATKRKIEHMLNIAVIGNASTYS